MSFLIILSALFLPVNMQTLDTPRSIIIFGNKDLMAVKQQWELLQKDSIGLTERDIQLTLVAPGGKEYQKFSVNPLDPFTVILVGRDGGEKYRSTEVTSTKQFFTLIDAMPMRKVEMRKQKNRLP